jgi:NAD+ kinase
VHILIVGDASKDGVSGMIDLIAQLCTDKGISKDIYKQRPDRWGDLATSIADLVIVVGGDGAILGTARALAGNQIDVIGINFGKIGFLASVERAEAIAWLDKIMPLMSDYALNTSLSVRWKLQATIVRKEKQVVKSHALNEVVIRASEPKTIGVHMEINGAQATLYRGDGLIISTPTGSTAYALSAGGPILQPEMKAFVICPICPHSVANRPLVIDSTGHQIALSVDGDSTVVMSLDGQENHVLEPGDRIYVSESYHALRLRVPKTWNYYNILASRLMWSGHTPEGSGGIQYGSPNPQ